MARNSTGSSRVSLRPLAPIVRGPTYAWRMDWTILVSVLSGAVGASIITAFVNWRMKIREEKHTASRWKLEKRLALYTKVVTLHRKLDGLSTRFATSYAEFLEYQRKPDGDETGLQGIKDRNREIYLLMQDVMQDLDVETHLAFIVASEPIAELLGRYGSAATVWIQTRFDYLEGYATEEAMGKASEEQSEAWLDFIQGARGDLGF